MPDFLSITSEPEDIKEKRERFFYVKKMYDIYGKNIPHHKKQTRRKILV